MRPQVPVIWYQAHVECLGEAEDRLRFDGLTVPGTPGSVIFHNSRICTSVTLGYCDVDDVYVEHFVGPTDERTGLPKYYLVNGQRREPEVIEETIVVKGKKPQRFVSIRTRHGPVISGMPSTLTPAFTHAIKQEMRQAKDSGEAEETSQFHLAVRSATAEPKADILSAMFKLVKARNYAEFSAAIEDAPAPILNMGFADVDGNIGYRLLGRIPVRPFPRGRELLPLPGWTDEYEWQGYVPKAEMPACFNPAQNYIISANHKIGRYENSAGLYETYLGKSPHEGTEAEAKLSDIQIETDMKEEDAMEYPHYLGSQFCVPFRAAAIDRLMKRHLEADRKFTVNDFNRMQVPPFNENPQPLCVLLTAAIGVAIPPSPMLHLSSCPSVHTTDPQNDLFSYAADMFKQGTLELEERVMKLLAGADSQGAALVNAHARGQTLGTCIDAEGAVITVDAEGEAPQAGLNAIIGFLRMVFSDFKEWDSHLYAESRAALFYSTLNVFLFRTVIATGIEQHGKGPVASAELPEQAYKWLGGLGASVVLKGISTFKNQWHGFVLEFLKSDEHPWVRTCGGRAQALLWAALESHAYITKHCGSDPSRWQWGQVHKAEFPHALGVALNTNMFDPPAVPVGGDNHAVAQAAFSTDGTFTTAAKGSVASARVIWDPSNWNNSKGILPLGQSERVYSANFANQLTAWQLGEVRPMPWSEEEIQKHARFTEVFASPETSD